MQFTPRRRHLLRLFVDGGPQDLPVEATAAGLTLEDLSTALPGTNLTGTVQVGSEDFYFEGEVSWAQAADPRLQLRGRAGLRFTSMPDAFFARLGEMGL